MIYNIFNNFSDKFSIGDVVFSRSIELNKAYTASSIQMILDAQVTETHKDYTSEAATPIKTLIHTSDSDLIKALLEKHKLTFYSHFDAEYMSILVDSNDNVLVSMARKA